VKVEPKDITVTSTDEKFLCLVMEIVEENIGNSEFDTAALSRAIGIGCSQLNVKLRALTGYSTREFIRTLRLKRAAQLLQQRFGYVAEVAYEVGFSSLSHFSKAFKEQFGMLPSEYKKKEPSES
jgi:AraC-like DNA-binding protein